MVTSGSTRALRATVTFLRRNSPVLRTAITSSSAVVLLSLKARPKILSIIIAYGNLRCGALGWGWGSGCE